MRWRRGERGENHIGCLLWMVVVLALGFVLYKVIPVKVNIVELYDHAEDLAQYSGRISADNIKRNFLDKAKELKLPVDPKKVVVEKTKDRIKIRYSFTVPLEFPGYTYVLKVEREVDRPIFYL